MVESNLSYREAQEQFVSGHDGSSLLEIFLLVSVAPSTVLARQLIYGCSASVQKRTNLSVSFRRWSIDFTLLVMPILCASTIFSSHINLFLGLILVANGSLAAFYMWNNYFSSRTSSVKPTEVVQTSLNKQDVTSDSVVTADDASRSTVQKRITSQINPSPKDSNPSSVITSSALLDLQLFSGQRQTFITTFRAYVNIATAICILGVDFVVFPRRFAKTETYGTGLMDAGVGAFVVSNAIVSLEARGKCTSCSSVKDVIQRISQSLVSTAPLLLLGVCRLIAVKGTDYHEHVTEYGVHWNFFFTLAVVKVLSSLILCVVPATRSWIVSVVVACTYQWMLTGSPLQLNQYILLGRDGRGSRGISLIDDNREGLFSCAGYLAIYFAGVQLGAYLLQSRVTVRQWCYTLLVLSVFDACLWLMLFLSVSFVEPVSRRMANLSYVIWIMAYDIQLVAGFLFVYLVQFFVSHSVHMSGHRSPASVSSCSRAPNKGSAGEEDENVCHLLEAVNYNGLLYFLLANVLTGVVNYTVSTIHASIITSLFILVVYMLILSAVSSLLYSYKICFKIW